MCHSSGESQWTSLEFPFIQSKIAGKVASTECHHLSERAVNTELELLCPVCSITFQAFYVLCFWRTGEIVLFCKTVFCRSPDWLSKETILPSLWQCFPSNLPIMGLVLVYCVVTRTQWCCVREGLKWWEVQDQSKSSPKLNWLESVVKLLCMKSYTKALVLFDFKILYLGMWSGRHRGAGTLMWPCIAKSLACRRGVLCTVLSSSGDCIHTHTKKYRYWMPAVWQCSIK